MCHTSQLSTLHTGTTSLFSSKTCSSKTDLFPASLESYESWSFPVSETVGMLLSSDKQEMCISYFPSLWENIWQFLYHHFEFCPSIFSGSFDFGVILSFMYVLPAQPFTQIRNIWKRSGSQMPPKKRSYVESDFSASLPVITFYECNLFVHLFTYIVNQGCYQHPVPKLTRYDLNRWTSGWVKYWLDHWAQNVWQQHRIQLLAK